MKRLLHEVKSSGRYVHVITYFDGATPIRGQLLFHSPDDAARCADLLREATVEEAAPFTGSAR